MAEIFESTPSALENTVKIAERCNVEFEFGKIKLPRFDIGECDHFEYFKQKCFDGLYRIYGQNPGDKYVDRLNYELSVINQMGYVDYFLIVADFVNFAKNLKVSDKKVLVVLPEANKNVYLSARNLAKASVMVTADVNTYSILDAKYMVLTEKAVADLTASFNA